MPFEPIFEDISLTQNAGVIKEQIKAECKTEVPSAVVSRILSVTARAVITKVDAGERQLSYEGKATFFVCFEQEDGAVCKCECGTEFKGAISQSGLKLCKVQARAVIDKTEADVSGVKLSVAGYITVEATVTECKKVQVLTGGNGLITDGKEISVCKGYGLRESVFPIEEEFELDYKIEDVLTQRAEPHVTAVQCGVGCIIVDGEVCLSSILLQNKEKNDIIRENKILPFRAEIECEDAMPSMSATAFVQEKSFKTDVAVDNENNKSIVRASVQLALSGEAFYNESVRVVEDAFSINDKVQIEKEEYSYFSPCDVFSDVKQIMGIAVTDSLPVGTTISSCIGEKVDILSTSCVDNRLCLGGVIYLTCLFKDSEGKIFSRKLESPFETVTEIAGDCNCDYTVRAIASQARVRLVSDTEMEISANLNLTVYPFEKRNVGLIKSLSNLGEKTVENHAISVYIPCEGEELWSLAKRLNVAPETLISTNQDLQFPLSGKERIVVYRQR
ncbi:MAG: DUF3794 domain-containing protein [Clostridia bacterium]|nr:DUF3794 domain-containing protein [Clostridia bacterium]